MTDPIADFLTRIRNAVNCIEISSRDKSAGYQITGTCVKTGFTSVH